MMIAEPDDAEAFSWQLEALLLESLRRDMPQAANGAICLAERADCGHLLVGLSGSTSYGWFLIKLLWVAPEVRRRRLASALVSRALTLARERGCHSAWLDTSNPMAHAFYLRLGFADFGHLENGPDQFPQTHRRWFMRRDLTLS